MKTNFIEEFSENSTQENLIFTKAKEFIYRNARPVDLARWQYHFENGNADQVLKALAFYQNKDGGFGHGLECDCFNPYSSPIQTWTATEILREIDFTDNNHPIINGILKYLDSGNDFDMSHNQWLNTVKTNNDYPHAIWWEYDSSENSFQYNPTACLAGFIISHADKNSSLYQKACKIIKEALDWFIGRVPFEEQHTTICFVRLYEYLTKSGADITDMELFGEKLKAQADFNLCKDTERWKKEYVTLPSQLINSKNSFLFKEYSELINAECEHIKNSQLDDGSYVVPWNWVTDYKEFEISANQVKSVMIIEKMLFLKNFSDK